jgi:hypothetical protein
VEATAGAVQTVIRLVNERPLDFVLFMGDLVNRPTDESVAEFVRHVKRIDKPVYLTIGNHDMGRAAEGFDCERKIAEALPGPWSDAFTYLFEAGGWNFIVLSMSSMEVPYHSPQVNHHKGYASEHGRISYIPRPHLEKFQEMLAASGDRPTCVVMHIPLVHMADRVHDRGCYDQVRLMEEIQLTSLIRERPNVKLALYGHQHFNQVDVLDGTLHCVTQGVKGYPPYGDPAGIRMMRLSPTDVRGRMFWDDDPVEEPAPIGTLAGDRSFEWSFA